MSSATDFTKLNDLVAADNGVFQSGQNEHFNYSDGAEIEQKLNTILNAAKDLSSNSEELESKISDWATEYHLSSSRANLLRGLDLSKVKRVLELGCGCGSISRYLGEQKGIQVDAVEGSQIRASLAVKRCKDLSNVTISTGNFNEFEFPQDYYDLVLYVGVTEYAGRFSERDTDQQALQDLLALGKKASRVNGVVLIAIENRIGLKYMLGASEDHYGIPFVGIDNYQNSTGIRTYTKEEWQSQIDVSGYHHSCFIYPFPDYKVPTLMLNEKCNVRTAEVGLALDKIKSRDYLTNFDLGNDEKRLWKTISEAGVLDKFTNSFLILLSDDEGVIARLANYNLLEYQQIDHSYRQQERADMSGNDVHRQKFKNARQRLEKRVSSLKDDLTELQCHADNLQQKIDLMTQSKGWTALNRLRSIIRKK